MLLPTKQVALGTIVLESCVFGGRELGTESEAGGRRVSLSKLSSHGDLACDILQWVPRVRHTEESSATGHRCHAEPITPHCPLPKPC